LIASPVRAKLSGVEFQNYTKNKCVLGLFFATQILEINIIFTISVQKLNNEHQESLRPYLPELRETKKPLLSKRLFMYPEPSNKKSLTRS
jgi:hypothetical protein